MIRATWHHIRELCGLNTGVQIGRRNVRKELLDLGLLGHSWDICDDFIPAVQKYVGFDSLEVVPYQDRREGIVSPHRLDDGVLADVHFPDRKNNALIVVRESLRERPWPAHDLCVLHEGSHLIGMHHLVSNKLELRESTIKQSWTDPQGEQDRLEVEARKRAKLLLLAHIAPEAFQHAGGDRVT